MKNIFNILILSIISSFVFQAICFGADSQNTTILSNHIFRFELPNELRGTYTVQKKQNGIFIYDKVSKRAGFGGFAFGIKAYLSPEDYAMMPGGKKLGELDGKNGKIYDIVLIQPTDVQYDYVTDNKTTYMPLYNLANTINKNISGKYGNVYFDKRGTAGVEMYKEVLNKHITAIIEQWSANKLEEEGLSSTYSVILSAKTNPLAKIGYALYDANGDGIEELLIGEISKENSKIAILDLYTMKNRKPIHVVSGYPRNRYYVCDGTFICNEYSSGAAESGVRVYALLENSSELFPQVGFKYDGYSSKKNPFFISYDFENDKWENVSLKTYIERKSTFDKYEKFNFIPLNSLKKL